MYTHKYKQGFVILIAVLISSLVVSLGAFIASIALKELALSSSGRQSQTAFYAADAALECALHQDLRVQPFAPNNSIPGPTFIRCDGRDFAIDTTIADGNSAQTFFDFSFTIPGETDLLSPYARVRVTKEDIGTVNDKTIIEAQGYNIQDTTRNTRVERALQVVY